MYRSSRLVAIATLLVLWTVLALSGCGAKQQKSDVVLWTAFDGAELDTLRDRILRFEQSSGRKVSLLKVPFNSLQRKVLVAGPALQGPDVLIGPQDWIGILKTADLLAPIPPEVVKPGDDRYYPLALRAVDYGGEVYSVPLMMDCVVLARNTKLVPTAPQNLDQLIALAQECQKNQPGTLGFAYRLDDLYFTWAFLAGHGSRFLDPFRSTELDLDAIDFATPQTVNGCTWVADLQGKYQLVEPGIENQTAVDFFLHDRLGMMICGPWNLSSIRSAGIAYELQPLPAGPVADCSPFLGVTGAMLSRYATDKPGVNELLEYLGSAETSALLCQSSGRAPARKDTWDLLRETVKDPVVLRDIELFSTAVQKATPLPNHPAISTVWPSMKTALALICSGQSQPQEELQATTERVRSKVRFMTE